MKKGLRLLTVTLCVALCGSILAACGPKAGQGEYTYREATSILPSMWNSHTWKTDSDNYVQAYTEMGFYDTTFADGDTKNFKWVNEMAAAEPVDITKDFADKAKYGLDENVDSSYVYKIALNDKAVFENGDKINAQSYVDSMELLLNPQYKNYRANSYYAGQAQIANAKNYYDSRSNYHPAASMKGDDVVYADLDGKELYFSLTKEVFFFGGNMATFYNASQYGPSYFTNANGVDVYKKWNDRKLANDKGWIKITDDNKAEVIADLNLIASKFGDARDEAWKEMITFWGDPIIYDFDNVGIKKTGEYELTLIFAKPISMFNLKVTLTSNWLVHIPTYTAAKNVSTVGDLKTTKYGTSVDTYVSYGPYKLSSVQTDKEIIMEKNPKWYGYSDGQHKGQYQTTRIKCSLIVNHDTQVATFENGDLDEVALNSTDMEDYRTSDYLMKAPDSGTWRYSFNTDEEKLENLKEDENNTNIKIMLYPEFRKGFSLAMDRAGFVSSTAAERPSFALLNNSYYYDMENDQNSIYRNTDVAKKVIVDYYGIEYGEGKTYKTLDEAYRNVDGYDLAAAQELMKTAVEKAVADQKIDTSKNLNIQIVVPAKEKSHQMQTWEAFTNNALGKAMEKTAFKGKVKVTFLCSENAYDKRDTGEFAMFYMGVSGATFYPYKLMGVFTNPANGMMDYGFDSEHTTLDITADFGNGVETKTNSFYNWQILLDEVTVAQGGYADAPNELKLQILAALEKGLLEECRSFPLTESYTVVLRSKKISYPTTTYNVFASFGGIRLMTYNFDDAEWETFKSKKENLKYN